MLSPTTPDALPSFVSRQVTEARRFFRNLTPDHGSRLEVVCGGVERVRSDYLVRRKDFPYYAIELVAEGEGCVTVGDESHPLSPGVVFAYGPGISHTIQNQSAHGMRKYYLDFVGSDAIGLLHVAGLRDQLGRWRPIRVGELHGLTELFEMLTRDAREEGPLTQSICETLTRLLLLKIGQLRVPEDRPLPRSHATYERVCRHMQRRFLHLSSVREVAMECEVTPVYLSRLFARFSDCGAHEFLMRQKMSYAAGLLMNEGLLVREAAERLGFADPFQFSRAFKRVYGVPPRQLTAGGQ